MICAVAIGLFLFLIFRASYGGTSPFLILWLLIAVLLIPMIAQESLAAAQSLAGSLVISGAAAVSFAWLAHVLVPDPPGTEAPTAAPATAADAEGCDVRAAITTGVVYPVALIFYSFGLMSDLVILVFVAILAQQPSLTAGRKTSGAVIVGNLGGGVAAMVFYQLLVAAPTLGFFVALTALSTLLVGTRIFSDRPFAPVYATVLSTVLLLVGGSIAPFGDDVGGKFTARIGQILVAVVYVVGALTLIERVRAERSGAAPA
jgi:hypothetical protein